MGFSEFDRRSFLMRATILALSVLSSLAGSATAGQITIHGLDTVYDGFGLYDAGSPFGGNQDPTGADLLTSASFYDDGVLQLSDLVDDGASLTGFDAAWRAAVSEPATLVLLGLGCLGLARYVRRA